MRNILWATWGVLPMPCWLNFTADAKPEFPTTSATPAVGHRHRARELSHDDFRRAHNNFRRAHNNFRRAHHDCRRSHDEFVMTFVARVPVPSAVCNNASGSGEEGDDAGKQQEHFHIQL